MLSKKNTYYSVSATEDAYGKVGGKGKKQRARVKEGNK